MIGAATLCLLGGALLRQFFAKRKAGGGNSGSSGKKGSVTYITGSALGALSGGRGGLGDGSRDGHWTNSELTRYEPLADGVKQLIDPPGKRLDRDDELWRWREGSFQLEDVATGRPHSPFPIDADTNKPKFYTAPTRKHFDWIQKINTARFNAGNVLPQLWMPDDIEPYYVYNKRKLKDSSQWRGR